MTTAQSTYRQKLRDIPQDYTASDYDALLEMEGEIPNRKLKHTVWEKKREDTILGKMECDPFSKDLSSWTCPDRTKLGHFCKVSTIWV